MLTIFSVHDSKAEAFIQPFHASNTNVGIRMFEAACNDPETDFAKFPGDYTLFELGTFDENTCKHDLHTSPKNLGIALSFQKGHE